MIQAHIFYFGQWEPNLTAFLKRRLGPGDTFIDVGANIGYFSLLASSIVGVTGNVVAIEASPSIFQQLGENVLRNLATNIRAVNVAASDKYGEVDLYRGIDGNQGSTTLSPALGTSREARVLAVPFDQILIGSELTSARVIKIDIEGAELPVLRCILSRIQDCRCDLEVVVEMASRADPDQRRLADSTIAEFVDAGFACYRLSNEFHIPRYLGRTAALPARRLTTEVSGTVDLIFSRERADYL